MKGPSLKPYQDRRNPRYRWIVWFDSGEGARKRRLFSSKSEARNFLREKDVDFQNLGRQKAATLTDQLKQDALDASARLEGTGASISEAVDFFLSHRAPADRPETVADAVRLFLEQKEREGTGARHLADLRNRLGKYVESFGDRKPGEIAGAEVRDWIHGLKVGAQTKNHYRSAFSVFSVFCVDRGLLKENPAKRIGKVKVIPSQTEIFTPEEMRILLETSEGDLLAYVLFGGFAGLRRAEIEKLQWEQVHLDRGIIELKSGQTKTAQRRIVYIEEVLKRWLEARFPFRSGPVISGPSFVRRERIWKQSLASGEATNGRFRINWKANGLRHSYASYLIASRDDAAYVSLQLGHSKQDLVFRHYREVATKEEADRWWGLFPSSEAGFLEVNSMTA